MSHIEKHEIVHDNPSDKQDVMMVESASGSDSDLGFDEKMTKKLVRKIDIYLVPFLSLLYLLSYLDRTNIGNARLGGIEADLGMSGLDYNASTISPMQVVILIMFRSHWRYSFLHMCLLRSLPIWQ